jgi:hypothetical protein
MAKHADVRFWIVVHNTTYAYQAELDRHELDALGGFRHRKATTKEFIRRTIESTGLEIDPAHVTDWSFRVQQFVGDPSFGMTTNWYRTAPRRWVARRQGSSSSVDGPPMRKRAAFCRSVLSVGARLLPAEVRGDALDEWTDEIATAEQEDAPVFRRTASILVRSLPPLAVRSYLPAPSVRGRDQ